MIKDYDIIWFSDLQYNVTLTKNYKLTKLLPEENDFT